MPKLLDAKQPDYPLFYRGFWSQTKLRLQDYYKRALKNPQWLLMFTLGRFRVIQLVAIRLSKRPAIATLEMSDSMFGDVDVDEAVKFLKKDGCYSGFRLPENVLHQIIDFSQQNYCYGDAEPDMGFLYTQKQSIETKNKRQFVRGDYFNSNLNCLAIQNIAKDQKLVAVARSYFGAEPVVSGTRLWWLFVNKTEYDLNTGAYFFHYDLDDYKCLKVFFYLTDVTQSNGTHVYVRGSHNKKKLKHLLSAFKLRSDREIIEHYGEESLVHIDGKAGTGFLEDVTCFHKATPPEQSDRLMLQVQFTLNDYGTNNDFIEPRLLKNALSSEAEGENLCCKNLI